MAFVLLAFLGRLRWPARGDWPIVLSVGALQLASFFALTNLGMQSLPAGRSSVLAYTASLWVVPLSLLAGEKVGRDLSDPAGFRDYHVRLTAVDATYHVVAQTPGDVVGERRRVVEPRAHGLQQRAESRAEAFALTAL